MKKVLITGGAGFIGSAVVRFLMQSTDLEIIIVDKLTYAGNLSSLEDAIASPRCAFHQQDICDREKMKQIFEQHQPDAIMHLAAESHVDRSIDGPSAFIQTNIIGTYNLLEVAREYWQTLPQAKAKAFRFHHISTDEVFGDLAASSELFNEESAYAPSSPYSASKASSDHLVRAWHRTYALPTIVTNCSNNYGPYHFPEKLIPLMIINALAGKPLPIYGDGEQIRDWLYVEDHARALYLVLTQGKVGDTYNIGGHNERTNKQVVEAVCHLLDELVENKPNGISQFSELITYVVDRPGHDLRYAIDASKIERELGWKPKETFESGLRKTVIWYLEHRQWWQQIIDKKYQGERLGLRN